MFYGQVFTKRSQDRACGSGRILEHPASSAHMSLQGWIASSHKIYASHNQLLCYSLHRRLNQNAAIPLISLQGNASFFNFPDVKFALRPPLLAS